MLCLAVAGASVAAGVTTYSISMASAVTAEPPSRAALQGKGIDCDWTAPNLDRYIQQNQLLPNLLSFSPTGGDLRPAGSPCDDDGGGGGGGGTSCLSTTDFDPDDYWAVLSEVDYGASSATFFAAPVDTFTPLAAGDIATTFGCTVTYAWTLSEVDWPFEDLTDIWNGIGASLTVTGSTSTSMTVSGLAFGNDWSTGGLYNGYLCGGNLVLRVSDGTDDYDIDAPPCSTYNFSSYVYSDGAGFTFEWEDPWGRDESYDQDPYDLATGDEFYSFKMAPTVRPSSPAKATFKITGNYTLKTGDDWNLPCDDPLVDTTVFSNTLKSANAVWSDPSPVTDRSYCFLEEITPP